MHVQFTNFISACMHADMKFVNWTSIADGYVRGGGAGPADPVTAGPIF